MPMVHVIFRYILVGLQKGLTTFKKREKMAVDMGKNDPLLELIRTPFNPPNESVVESICDCGTYRNNRLFYWLLSCITSLF